MNISSIEALLLGSTPNSSLISFAIGPAITIATVLFAVQISTDEARTAIPNSAPLVLFTFDFITFSMACIPPFSFTSSTVPPIIIESTVISNIPETPSPTTVNISLNANVP